MFTRGIKNNNPGNIRRSSQKWLGLSKFQSDSQFCRFNEMKYGIRAFFVLMRTYRYKYGLKSPADILKRYAPAKENDLTSYYAFLSSHLIDVNRPLLSDVMYCIFAKWVFRFESNYICSIDYLQSVLCEFDLRIINKSRESHELSLF